MRGDVAGREELREIVAADIAHMRKGWTTGDLDWHTVRREAGMLRRLLTEGGAGGDIRRLWRLDDRPGLPQVECADLRPYLGSLELLTAEVVHLPDYILGPIRLSPTLELTADPVRETWASRPLDRYVKAVSVIYRRTAIRRADVIEFVANKLGGTHFDRTRDPAKRAAFVALDEIRSRIKIDQHSILFVQVLGIAQTIAENDDVADLVGLPHVETRRRRSFRDTPG